MTYWWTLVGQFEVDCLIGDKVAIEIKASENFKEKMLSGLLALKEEKKFERLILVSRDPIKRVVQGIDVVPYQIFLDELWTNQIVS